MDLYINPLKVWKKVLSNRKSSYDIVILHLFYYLVLVLLTVEQSTKAIFYVLTEAALTIIPFLLLILPFTILSKAFKKKIRWNRLFRILLILKLQFIPFVIVLTLAIKFFEAESLYIILNNFLGVFCIALIITLPLILKLKYWQKTVWIFLNYLFFVSGTFIIGYSLSQLKDSNLIIDKIQINSPSSEYTKYLLEKGSVEILIEHQYYLVLIKPSRSNEYVEVRPQFVTFPLLIAFNASKRSKLIKEIIFLDSLRTVIQPTYRNKINWKDSINYITDKKLSINRLDSSRLAFTKMFNEDLERVKFLKDSSKFTSNRPYFKAIYNYLNTYNLSFTLNDSINNIIKRKENAEVINYGNENYVVLFKVNTATYDKLKKTYQEEEEGIKRIEFLSNFLFSIIFYPFEILLDFLPDDEE